ncbi:hypothetical protein QYF61_000750 [Mycteria americana]|uniref:Uncharacterized protein n=1 Tax=Mycteria americana TaxID=33587 RepID=A0AAN7NQQ2_MYCAM|nr:hypothetical protein QYF61_000750 [Mycteria americana]
MGFFLLEIHLREGAAGVEGMLRSARQALQNSLGSPSPQQASVQTPLGDVMAINDMSQALFGEAACCLKRLFPGKSALPPTPTGNLAIAARKRGALLGLAVAEPCLGSCPHSLHGSPFPSCPHPSIQRELFVSDSDALQTVSELVRGLQDLPYPYGGVGLCLPREHLSSVPGFPEVSARDLVLPLQRCLLVGTWWELRGTLGQSQGTPQAALGLLLSGHRARQLMQLARETSTACWGQEVREPAELLRDVGPVYCCGSAKSLGARCLCLFSARRQPSCGEQHLSSGIHQLDELSYQLSMRLMIIQGKLCKAGAQRREKKGERGFCLYGLRGETGASKGVSFHSLPMTKLILFPVSCGHLGHDGLADEVVWGSHYVRVNWQLKGSSLTRIVGLGTSPVSLVTPAQYGPLEVQPACIQLLRDYPNGNLCPYEKEGNNPSPERQQLQHRKAISRSGLQHLAPVHSLNIAVSNGPVKEPRAALEWTENAVNGEHLWLETNVSGDLCYLGEESCQVKFSVTSLISDWYSALVLGSLNCLLLLLMLVFQEKECKKGTKGCWLNTLSLGEKSPKQF